MTGPLLRVDRLNTRFFMDGLWRTVVDQVEFEVSAGETLAVVGESGSGKSVTALSIMRLLPAANARSDGAIHFAGADLQRLPEAAMERVRGSEIAMIFQEPMTSLNPVLPVGFQVAEALRRHRGLDAAAARAETLRLFERVRIPAARDRFADYPHRFSGGMRQRVMIALALSCRPKLLIADEPTTALDVTVQAQILALIRELQREDGMAVMFITHDMGVVAEIADRVLVMWQGRKVEEGPVAGVFQAPAEAYTRTLLRAVPRLGAMRGRTGPQPFVLSDSALPPPKPSAQVRREGGPLLSVEGLTTRFDIRGGLLRGVVARVHAVENVSFAMQPGETLALVGESGCGKSTTGRTILRLVEPHAGSIRFDGQDVRAIRRRDLKALRRRMQMIFQDPYGSLDPRRSVGQSIAEPILAHGLATRRDVAGRVAELLRRVGLSPDMAPRLPHEFSGGQRQRICIARALGLAPALVVADECVSALDATIKAQVLNLMMELQAELGLAYLFVSHDMAAVERVSHRIAVMYMGEIVEIGPRAAVIENPQHPYTRRLLAAVPVPDPARARRPVALDSSDVPSPVRPLDYRPPTRYWREVEPGHRVQEWAA